METMGRREKRSTGVRAKSRRTVPLGVRRLEACENEGTNERESGMCGRGREGGDWTR